MEKSSGHLLAPKQVRYQFVEDHREMFPVVRLCRALNVSPSGYYAWRDRPASKREMANQELVEKIKEIHTENREVYGSPRLYQALLALGWKASKNRVARLMRKNGIRAKQTKRFKTTTQANDAHPVAPNLLGGDFAADQPNRKWLTDITYILTLEGWLYLACVMDLFSRRIVGWAMSARMTSSLVMDALNMAVRQRQPAPDLLHHSDRAPVRAFIFSGGDTPFPAEEGIAQRLTLKSKDRRGQSVTRKKRRRGFHQTNGFLGASSTWRKLGRLNPRIERDLWYRVGKMVTPTLSWIRGRSVAALYLRARDAS